MTTMANTTLTRCVYVFLCIGTTNGWVHLLATKSIKRSIVSRCNQLSVNHIDFKLCASNYRSKVTNKNTIIFVVVIVVFSPFVRAVQLSNGDTFSINLILIARNKMKCNDRTIEPSEWGCVTSTLRVYMVQYCESIFRERLKNKSGSWNVVDMTIPRAIHNLLWIQCSNFSWSVFLSSRVPTRSTNQEL